MLHPLQNYIRTYRRRVALSQKELGLLIGHGTRSSLSEYERGLRLPRIDDALALEIVLGESLQEIFSGVACNVRKDLTFRSRALLESLEDEPTAEFATKVELLSRLARLDDEITFHPIPEEQG